MATAQSRHIPLLTPRPFEGGSGWYVEVYWIGGQVERLGRLQSYSEAHDWIMLEAAAYFVMHELA